MIIANRSSRYLMCSGSILSSTFILTSASCIHEITYVRHNIRAPLAVLIAPFSDDSQVIKIVDYYIHPNHVVDPRNESHPRHNLVVAKLECSISSVNFKKIELPDKPLDKECINDNCHMAVIKRRGQSYFSMYQTSARFTQNSKRKRKRASIAGETKRASSSGSRVLGKRRGLGTNTAFRNRGRTKSISVRESTGVHGCAQTGTPVISNGTVQAALVVSACDDRHSDTPWRYTDLFDNVDWLTEMSDTTDTTSATPPTSTGPATGSCSTCIYNIIIAYNPNDNVDHNNNSDNNNCSSGSACVKSMPDINVPGLDLAKCKKNDTAEEPTTTSPGPPELHQASKEAYFKAINKMYRNSSDDDVNVDVDVATTEASSEVPVMQSQYSTYTPKRASPNSSSPLTSDYVDQEDVTTESPKSTVAFEAPDNPDLDVGLGGPAGDQFNHGPEQHRVSIGEYFHDNRYEEAGLPGEYAELYKRFKAEKRRSNPDSGSALGGLSRGARAAMRTLEVLLLLVTGSIGNYHGESGSRSRSDFRPVASAWEYIADHGREALVSGGRRRRERPWMDGDVDRSDNFLKMHAFLVRDEVIPPCFEKADQYSKRRYFMCSGIVLNERLVLTSASCINRAQIYEYHVNAELAVLIGSLDEASSYVIKIEDFRIHPRYVPDPSSADHARNNIAILMLSCSIPRKSLFVPSLPSDVYGDIGHVCCSSGCRLFTVVENMNNELTVEPMNVKHLPSPSHDKNVANAKEFFSKYFHKKIANARVDRAVARGSSLFDVSSETAVVGPSATKFVHKLYPRQSDDATTQASVDSQNDTMTKGSDSSDGATTTRVEEPQKTQDVAATTVGTHVGQNSEATTEASSHDSSVDHPRKSIDWSEINLNLKYGNMTDPNKVKLRNLVKHSMIDIMSKILDSMTDQVSNIQSTFQDIKRIVKKNITANNATEIILGYSANQILKSSLEGLDISSFDFKDAQVMPISEVDPQFIKKYVFCPPLGSPIVSNDTVVGLVAYTCDDLQRWVQWQYVDVSRNLDFIQAAMESDLQ
ncbi:uncharacterized protein LOC111643401 [Copidosoma floridanum]|uniref:uncharacterized protein LOC111643401 n=1 Tax=Copidosoma floridanum TaxID=29053 RepID=UPI000C6FAD96|nr:uncharacterized protein LOC111643401 [Copidosoma floridanum]